MAEKKLYRSEEDKMLAGVCGGIAEVYNIDPTIVRLLTLALVLGTGFGLFIYIGAVLLIPKQSQV